MPPDLSQTIQLIGAIVSVLVVLNQLLNIIRFWRGGTPELRLVRDQVNHSNEEVVKLLNRIIEKI